MNLFVNAISKNAYIALFDNKRNISSSKYFEVSGNESSIFISVIDIFLKENNLTYFDLKNIIVVNGPGSFTGVRTIVLAINTIAFVVNSSKKKPSNSPLLRGRIKQIFPPLQGNGGLFFSSPFGKSWVKDKRDLLYLTSISYFDLYNNYPIIKSSSKKDSFFKKEKNSSIEIIYNDELEKLLKNENIKTIYGEGDIKNIEIIEKINYINIIKNIKFEKYSKIEALYVKKPNIC